MEWAGESVFIVYCYCVREKVVYVEMIQSLWKCLKVEALPSPPAQAEELVSHEKQVKRPPLLEEELVLTLAATLLKC